MTGNDRVSEPLREPGGLTLDGLVVVLTGASAGLGVQFARSLGRAGARLALVARREDKLADIAAELDDAIVLAADVTDPATPREIVARTLERYGRIDGLVNNAGITNVAPALREDDDIFRRVLEVNLVAPFSLSKAVADSMRETGGGAIVNVSSVAGLRALVPLPEAGYAASKAGMLGLTRELATQWARYGVRVNALAPGGFSSDMTGDAFEAHGTLGGYMSTRVPLARCGKPGELDTPLLLLLHPTMSYLTGQVIAVDGGLSAC